MFLSAAGVQLFKFQKWPNAAHRADERSDTSHYVVTMWSQSCQEITQVVSKFYKVSQGCVNAMLSQSCVQVFQSCVKVVAKLSQSCPERGQTKVSVAKN